MKDVRYWARIMVKNRKFLLLLRVEPKKKNWQIVWYSNPMQRSNYSSLSLQKKEQEKNYLN